jgi:hypothetical protein
MVTRSDYIDAGLFLVRNSSFSGWFNAVWNQVFSGVVGAPAQSFPNPTYTTLPQSPVTREKPFLYVDSAGHNLILTPGVYQLDRTKP